jgi:acylphosphatase
MKARVHVLIGGRVQGVFFRGQTERWAAERRLTGWVRNRFDGRVEVLAEGERPDLDELVGLLRQGPPFARVDTAEVHWGEYAGEFDAFRVRPTGD